MFAQGPGAVDLPPAERPKLEPGAAIGVQLLGGDIDATAIGTVTYVKGNVVLDRKTLADIAVHDPDTFTKILELAKQAL